MSALRWKGQSLHLYRHLTKRGSVAAEQGLLPRYASLAYIISSLGGAIAGLAMKAWRDGDYQHLNVDELRSYRRSINEAFDQLEAALPNKGAIPTSGIDPAHQTQAQANYDNHGNFAILGLALIAESSELAEPLMDVASGRRTFRAAKPFIDMESADLRVFLHITSEQAEVSAEQSTSAKWTMVRDRFPEIFPPQKSESTLI